MSESIRNARILRSELAPHWGRMAAYQWGKVVNITAGPPPTVDLQLDGSSATTTGLYFVSSYIPVLNDVVAVARMVGPAQTGRFVIGQLSSLFQTGTRKVDEIIIGTTAGYVSPPTQVNFPAQVSALPTIVAGYDIEIVGRTSQAGNFDEMGMRFSGDAGANYAYERLTGNASSALVQESGATWQTSCRDWFLAGNGSAAGWPGTVRIHINDPVGTTFRKIAFIDWNMLTSAAPPNSGMTFRGGTDTYWNSTAAITAINIFPLSGATINVGTTFRLYARQ